MGAESHAPDAYLLDTATLLWVIAEPDRLSRSARAIWTNPRAVIAVSVVSYWEVLLKSMKGNLEVGDPRTWWHEALEQLAATALTLRPEHVAEVYGLPRIHRDPFDRVPYSIRSAARHITAMVAHSSGNQSPQRV